MIAVGDKLPNITLKTLTLEGGIQDLPFQSLFEGKKVVIFAVPGAFTPTCSKTHVPSFLSHFFDFQKKGVDRVMCLSVNDPFVMKAWADALNADPALVFLADGNGEFTEAVGMSLDGRAFGLGRRSRRYVLMAEDGVVKVLEVEEAPNACTVTHGASFLKKLP